MSDDTSVILSVSCMCILSAMVAAALAFILYKKRKRGAGGDNAGPGAGAGGGGGAGAGAGAGGAGGGADANLSAANNAADFAGQAVSSKVSDVSGLAKTASSSQYTDAGDNRTIIALPGAPEPKRTEMRTYNRKTFTRGDGKKMMARSIADCWPVLKKYFSITDAQKERFLGLILGQCTRESTLNVDIETGMRDRTGKLQFNSNPAHAYGLLQTAGTAFKGVGNGYMEEKDVPEMKWYEFVPENFYDPMISNFMGLRKMCHFAKQAKEMYKQTDPQVILRLAVQGHNTGWAKPGETDVYLADYPDQIARMGEWYYSKGNLTNDAYTWSNAWKDGHWPKPVQGAAWKENWAWFWK